jgi:cytochrome c5
MKPLFVGMICILALTATALSVSATPKKRYDKKTETCRVLNSGPLEWESLPWGKGGKGFKQVCKSCHSRDNATGAPFLWEESKSSKGWNRVFASMRADCANDGSWSSLSDDQLLMVNDYLYRWSSTSLSRNDSA